MKQNKWLCMLTAALLLLLAGSASASADIITQPGGLNPGDPYRLIFVTSTGRDATAGTFAPYDLFVNTSANSNGVLSALSLTWQAVVSVPTNQNPNAARDHTGTSPTLSSPNNIPVYNLQGQLIASTYADLWDGSIANAIRYDEFGASVSGSVWTGTAANGFGIAARQMGNANVQVGNPLATNNTWIGFNGGTILPSSESHSFYGISGTLYAVPEPSSLCFLGLGAVGLIGYRRRRK